MNKNVELLNGSIAGSIAKLALPIMGTSLIQMAYNLTDMIWIGHLGSNAVAAVGAAGMYMWLSSGFALLPRMGGQVMTGQAMGAGKKDDAARNASAAITLGIIMSLVYGFISIVFCGPMIGFFNLSNPQVIHDGKVYIAITCGFIFFNFMNQILTGLLTSLGNSMLTFRATTIGLIINLILDPLLIFGIGPLPALGVIGAALATVFAQVIVFVIFFHHIYNDEILFAKKYIFGKPDLQRMKSIFSIGFPAAIQSLGFTLISMVISRIISGWGDAAIAVQRVGTQIESISWMTAEGFGSALNAFTAQNYGAGKNERVKKGYRSSLIIMGLWGLFTTFVLVVFPEQIFRLFIREADVIPMGVNYLRILGLSQLFLCTETAAAGVFQGLGKSAPPSIVGIAFNLARIPSAIILSATVLKLNGIWWSISISSMFKGTVLPLWLAIYMRKLFKNKKQQVQKNC